MWENRAARVSEVPRATRVGWTSPQDARPAPPPGRASPRLQEQLQRSQWVPPDRDQGPGGGGEHSRRPAEDAGRSGCQRWARGALLNWSGDFTLREVVLLKPRVVLPSKDPSCAPQGPGVYRLPCSPVHPWEGLRDSHTTPSSYKPPRISHHLKNWSKLLKEAHWVLALHGSHLILPTLSDLELLSPRPPTWCSSGRTVLLPSVHPSPTSISQEEVT